MALRNLLIIPSGRTTVWDRDTHVSRQTRMKARDAYTGRFTQRCAQYAQKHYPGDWCILSPRYGFLMPDEEILPHDNVTFEKGGMDLETIAINAGADGLIDYNRVVFLGNEAQYQDHIEIIREIFGRSWIEFPLISAENHEEMLGMLVDSITRNAPLRCNTITLCHISVSGLFGYFNHDIPLFPEEHLSIITAPNGYGKTTILRLLRAVFMGNVRELKDIPFDTLTLSFLVNRTENHTDSREVLTIQKKNRQEREGDSGREEPFHILFSYRKTGGDISEYALNPQDYDENEASGELSRIIPPIPVKYISAQRLWQSAGGDGAPEGDLLASYDRQKESTYELTILAYSDDIARRIQAMLADFAASSQELDSTFPKRYAATLMRNSEDGPSAGEIGENLALLQVERKKLEELGFLSSMESNPSEILTSDEEIPKDPAARQAIALYLNDTWKKYQVFGDLREKIDLLQQIVNDLFVHMNLKISVDNGFTLIFHDRETIPPEHLSSGEQNQLVMYYDLLFRSDPGTLVLIDEPEISLHIVWQRQFLEYIRKIIGITGSDFILATHSPQLIHVSWDYTIDLVGDVNAEK